MYELLGVLNLLGEYIIKKKKKITCIVQVPYFPTEYINF